MEITLEKVHKRLLRIQNYLYNNNGETWNTITCDGSWTVGGGSPANPLPQYMMLPNGFVAVRGLITCSGTTGILAINNTNPVPAAYRPAATRYYRQPIPADTSGTVQMGTNGILTMRASGFSATQAILDGIYAL